MQQQNCVFEERAAEQQRWPAQYCSARVNLSNILLCLHGATGAGDHIAASALRFMDVALGNDSRHELWSFKADNPEGLRMVSLRNYEQALAAARLNGGRFRQAGQATQTGAGWPEQKTQPQNQASCVPIALLCLGHAAYCLAYKATAPVNSSSCIPPRALFLLCGQVLAGLFRDPTAILQSWQHEAERELLLLSTPASKFEGGLRCALGGAFGVDASLAAAAQRDAGATIVNVTSSVQHIPHVSTLATGNLSQTLTLLQESLMDVYTAYRGVVQKHSGLANLVQSSVLLHFLEYTCRQQPPTAREGNLETANPIGAYLKSQGHPQRKDIEMQLFIIVHAACAHHLRGLEIKLLNALNSHVLRPSIVSVVFELSRTAGLHEALGCPSDATSTAFSIVGAAWRALCQAKSPQEAAQQRKLVLDAAAAVLQEDGPSGGDNSVSTDFAELGESKLHGSNGPSVISAAHFTAAVLPIQLSLPKMQEHAEEPPEQDLGNASDPRHMLLLPHKLMGKQQQEESSSTAGSLVPAPETSIQRFWSQGTAESVSLCDPHASQGGHLLSFEGAEVGGLQSTASGCLSPRASFTSWQRAAGQENGQELNNFMSQAEQVFEGEHTCTRAPTDPSGNTLLSPKRRRRASMSDPGEAPLAFMSPPPLQSSEENRTPHSSATRHPLAPLRQQPRCHDFTAEGELGRSGAGSPGGEAVCRRIAFDDAAVARAPPVSLPGVAQLGGGAGLRGRRSLPPIQLAAAPPLGVDISSADEDVVLHGVDRGDIVSLRPQGHAGGAGQAVRLPPIHTAGRPPRSTSSHFSATMQRNGRNSSGSYPLQGASLSREDSLTDEEEDDCALEQLGGAPLEDSTMGGSIVCLPRPDMRALPAFVPVSPASAGSPGLSCGGHSPGMDALAPSEGNPLMMSPLVRYRSASGGSPGSVKRYRSGEPALPPPVALRTVWSRSQPEQTTEPTVEAPADGPLCVLLGEQTLLDRVALALGFVRAGREQAAASAQPEHLMCIRDLQELSAEWQKHVARQAPVPLLPVAVASALPQSTAPRKAAPVGGMLPSLRGGGLALDMQQGPQSSSVW